MSLEVMMRLLQNILSMHEAIELARRHVRPGTHSVSMALPEALGRYLSEDVFALTPLPHFSRSTMDGFAVRAADTVGSSESLPMMLAEGAGCVAVLTGGEIPAGYDAVVMIEYTTRLEDGTILVERPVAYGENIIQAGEDVAQGGIIARRGERITSRQTALLAACGVWSVPCNAFSVLVLSSGNEIVPVAETPGVGYVRDSNGHCLVAMCREIGLEASYGGIIADDPSRLMEKLKSGLSQYDAVLLSGGSSAGSLDHTAWVVRELGSPGLLVHGLAIKPGKPTVIGVAQGKLVLGLPGHPLSCALTAHMVARPLLRYAAGLPEETPVRREGQLQRALSSVSGRRDHIPIRMENGMVVPLISKSAALKGFADSDGILVIDESCEGLTAGAVVSVELWGYENASALS